MPYSIYGANARNPGSRTYKCNQAEKNSLRHCSVNKKKKKPLPYCGTDPCHLAMDGKNINPLTPRRTRVSPFTEISILF